MANVRIRLKFKSYDHRLLDQAVKHIVLAVKKTGAQLMGPVPLPVVKRSITVNTSPHIDKRAREQFSLTTYNRVLDISYSSDKAAADKVMEALMALNISSGVHVDIR